MKKVKIGQKVRVGIETKDGQILQLYTRISDIDFDRITLEYTPDKDKFAQFLYEGADIRLSVYTRSGILLMHSIVIEPPENNKFIVEFSSRIKKIQRRSQVRVKVHYRLVLNQIGTTFTALTEDISGNGVKFISDAYIHPSEIDGKLFIPEFKEPIKFTGSIVLTKRFARNEYLVLFNKIEEDDRKKIIKKCFELSVKHSDDEE